jgi:chaperonin cofactor prefoldin
MTTTDEFDTEIERLQNELRTVARAPATINERFEKAKAELRQAEQVFRAHGLNVSASHPGETAHLQRLALLGACMVVGSAQLLKVERQRIEQAGEGLSEREKTERLAQLRRQIERLCAKRELQLREQEAPGEFLPRPPLHAELAVFRRSEVERLAR